MTIETDPLSAFVVAIGSITQKLNCLSELATDHLGHSPDSIHWGHVADAKRVDVALGDILRIAGVEE